LLKNGEEILNSIEFSCINETVKNEYDEEVVNNSRDSVKKENTNDQKGECEKSVLLGILK